MPPQGEARKRSVGRRYSSFVTLHRRVGAGSCWLLAARGCCHALLHCWLLGMQNRTIEPCAAVWAAACWPCTRYLVLHKCVLEVPPH